MRKIIENQQFLLELNNRVFIKHEIIDPSFIIEQLAVGKRDFTVNYDQAGLISYVLQYSLFTDKVSCCMSLEGINGVTWPCFEMYDEHNATFTTFNNLKKLLKFGIKGNTIQEKEHNYNKIIHKNSYFKVTMNKDQSFSYQFTFFPKKEQKDNIYYLQETVPSYPTLVVNVDNGIVSGNFVTLCMDNIHKQYGVNLIEFSPDSLNQAYQLIEMTLI